MTSTSDDTDAASTPPAGADQPPSRSGPLRSVGKVLATIVVAASFGTWVYAFSGAADREPPDRLDDPTWSQAAEPICAAALVDASAVPDALEAADEGERADQIRATTAVFTSMVDQLAELEATTDRDDEITGGWLDDWRVMIGDRLDYADRIAADPNAQFYLTDTGVGERLDRRITRMATTNRMPSCGTPTDVG